MAQYTQASSKVLESAVLLAQENAHSQLSPYHVGVALLESADGLLSSILTKAGGSPEVMKRVLSKGMIRLPSISPPPEDVPSFSPAMAKVLRRAGELMKEKGDTFVAVDHLILALAEETTIAASIKEAGSSLAAVKTAVVQVRGSNKADSATAEGNFEALAKYARDLTEAAEKGMDPVIGRDQEIRRVIRILSRRTKSNPVLVGPPGVGNTALAELLALRIVARDVPANLLDNKLFSLDIAALHAGASYKGEFEQRVKSVLDEIEASPIPIVLFIDEMHLLMAGQGSGGVDAANILKPALARGKLRVCGATTDAEYKKYIEADSAFERRFAVVQVNEPTVPQAISILRGIVSRYESHHGVEILDSALVAAATLAARYLPARRLPDSAIDLIDEAAANVRVNRDSQPEEVDRLERQKLQLEIELTALKRESERSKGSSDDLTQARISELEQSIAGIKEELAPIVSKWQEEKMQANEIQSLKKKLEELKAKAEEATRRYDLASAADIQHYAIPDVTSKLDKLEGDKRRLDTAAATAGGPLAGSIVTADAIAAIVSQWSGVPVQSLKISEKQKLLRLESTLSKAVIGQGEAVKAVCDAIRLSRSGLSDENRPIASFLFVGTSGSGKTLLAQQLSKLLFDSSDAMFRIDSSEYSEKHSISRLIGSPPGYVGSDAGGQLTEFVRRKPYSVILVDEIEKASKEFHQVFLQVLDNGRLTDGKGIVVNFRNTVIIMTSNLGALYLNDLPDGTPISTETKELVQGAIKGHFSPEFINRIDSTVIFSALSRAQVRSIVDIRIAEVQKRLNSKNMELCVDSAALDYLGNIGYHPSYGARPLNRAIQTELLHPLSRAILEESVRDGEQVRIVFDAKANRLVVLPNHEVAVGMEMDEDSQDDDDIEIEEIDD